MSKTVDERVVSMQFDNRQFEQNVRTSMSTLDRLKQSLNLNGAAKGLENVNTAAKGINMSGLGRAVETVGAKFSALQVMGVTALANITNSVVNTGKRMVSALTIDPIKAGFQEYETQINSVQTILANTSHQGTTIQQVNAALDELNTYADKTIYNFTEMTRNIGTFTAAGVDLRTSVDSIRGIANLAAVSGSTSQQASTAMYQLSQALAAGKVSLMDWNSVVNAGMGGKVFQDALIRTSELLGTGAKKAVDTYGSFRESLTKGEWLTTEVLTETLKQFAGAYSEADLIAQGFTESQAKEIAQMANTAEEAATKVKTFTQLWDTLKESAQSGWTQSWEIIIGDFDEAKETLTRISETIGGMIGSSAESRNTMLSKGLSTGWKQLLGQGIADEAGYIDSIQEVARKNGDAFDKMVEDSEDFSDALKKGLKDGTITSETLSEAVFNLQGKMSKMSAEERKAAGYTDEMVKQIEELSSGLKDGSVSMDEFADKILKPSGRENLIEALWNAFEGLMSVITPIKEAFREIFPAITGEQLYSLTERIKKFTEGLTLSSDEAGKVKRIFKGLFSILAIGAKAIGLVVGALYKLTQTDTFQAFSQSLLDKAALIGDFFTSLNESLDVSAISNQISKFTSVISGRFSAIMSKITDIFKSATDGVSGFSDVISSIGNTISRIASKIWGVIKTVFGWIRDNVSAGDIFAGLAGGGIFVLATKIGKVVDKIKDIFDLFSGDGVIGSIKENFTDVLDSVSGALQSFTTGVKAASLLSIAIAVGILSASLKTISQLNGKEISKSLFAIGALLTMLMLGFKSLSKTLNKFDSKGIVKSGLALILVAKAIDILADAMVTIAGLSWKQIVKGLAGVGGGLIELAGAVKIIGKTKVSLSTSIAILALAKSCEMLGDAIKKFSGMSWDEISRGLVGMGGALGELVAAVSILGKTGGFKSLLGSVGILIAVQSLEKMSEGLKSFAEMNWDEIGRGLAAMGGALGELTATLSITGKIAGFSSIFAAGAIWIVVQSLDDLASALKSFAEMTWDEIGRGLSAMGGALGEVGIVISAVDKVAGASSIFAAGAIWVVIQGLDDLASSLKSFAEMQWDEIGRGLTAMGGALGEVGIVTGAVGKLAGFSGIFGSGAILLTIQGLDDLAESLKKFGDMTWDEIARGLVGMGGALTEVGVVAGTLGVLAGPLAIVGSGSLLLSIQGLGDLADAFKKFGEMNWDEIGRGLAAMGGALGEIALGGFLNTLSIIGSFSISEMAEPLGVLADSVKKWAGVTIPKGLGWQLSTLAFGVQQFTFAGWGASAIAEAAAPLGTLADSVKKWTGVVVPDGLSDKLKTLASGVSSFTFSGIGAFALAEAAGPLGTLADSVKKWTGIDVPDTIQGDLTQIADGVKAFTWAFAGGWSINAIVKPLAELPDSIKKWNGIDVPDTIQSDLTAIANGVQAFSWAFLGGWSIGDIVEPLGNLAGSIKKWIGVDVPDTIQEDLTSIATGVKEFSFAFVGGWSIGAIVGPLGDLAGAIKKWNGIKVSEDVEKGLTSIAKGVKEFTWAFVGGGTIADIAKPLDTMADAAIKLGKAPTTGGDKLKSLATGAKALKDVGDISSVVTDVKSVVSASGKLAKINFGSIKTGLTGLATGLKKMTSLDLSGISSLSTAASTISSVADTMKKATSKFKSVGVGIAESISKGFKSKQAALKSTMTNTVTMALKSVTSKTEAFHKAGIVLSTKLVTGLKSQASKVKTTLSSTLNSAAGAIRTYRSSFYTAGNYLGDGLVSGINAKKTAAYNAGYALGQKAVQGEKDGQASKSPSKLTIKAGKWLGEGLIIGMEKMGSAVYKTGHNLGDSAAKSLTSVVSRVSDMINSDIDAQPTIRPVLDLSDVRSGVGTMSGLLNMGSSVGVMANVGAINAMMNRRNQNGGNLEVVSAIEKLRKDLGNVGNTSYTVNGVTYDDGSAVSEAVKTLVRATVRERRI